MTARTIGQVWLMTDQSQVQRVTDMADREHTWCATGRIRGWESAGAILTAGPLRPCCIDV